jgi:hypothetical protein
LNAADVKKAMYKKLSGSGLTTGDALKLKLKPLTSTAMEDIEGLPQYLGGFVIPYFNVDGATTSFLRVRYLEQPTGFSALTNSPIRYAQPAGSTNEVYLSPFTDWSKLLDSEDSLIITEGELKSACATKHGMPTIGLGGVTMFSDRKHGNFVLPGLAQFTWSGRKVFVVFDSDAATNPNILRAEAMLCRELTRLGAVPFITRLPQLGEAKTGLDDFIVAKGAEELIEALLKSEPYFPAHALHKLNEEVVYVDKPDVVVRLSDNHRMRTEKFVSSHYANRVHLGGKDGKSERSTASDWIRWEHRSYVRDFTYRPGCPQYTDDNKLNLWETWPYSPQPGSVKMWHTFLDHIFKDTPENSRKWFEQWVAYPMQYPGTKLKQAVIMWGGQGTGKSLLGETIMRLYGPHNATKFDNSNLNSAFNDWAEHRQFAVGEEIVVHASEKRSISELLKTLITDTSISINRKYAHIITLPNCMNCMLLSNHAASLKLEEDDRRYFVHHVKSDKLPESIYKPFDKWSKSEEGLSALFDYFLNLDTESFNPQAAAPLTHDKSDMVSGGRSEHAQWVSQLQDDPDNVLRLGKAAVPYSLFSTEDLFVLYRASHERTNITTNTLANELRMQRFSKAYPGAIRTSTGSKNLWVIRHDDRFKRMTPSQFGEWYDQERGRGSKTTTPAPKSKPKGAK